MNTRELQSFLDGKYKQYHHPGFIKHDPIVIPHLFTKKQDIEVMGFFAAVLAWGKRVTIINKCHELIKRMDGNPHDFILHHDESDLRKLEGFVHRTFNDTDLLYFVERLKRHYQHKESLEDAFVRDLCESDSTVERGLIGFHRYFFDQDHPARTRKHVSDPSRGSACKRLNMYLRWMVRSAGSGVDFGIWKKIKPSQLVCPCDLHVERVARKLGLITRRQADWQMALELTEKLRAFDKDDPVKYDFALFGLGIEEKF